MKTQADYQRKYRQTEKGKASVKRWNNSEKGKAAQEKYLSVKENREKRRKRVLDWAKTPKGKYYGQTYKKWYRKDTENGRLRRYKERKMYYSKTAFLYKARPYTEKEDELIVSKQYTDHELSDIIKRSVGAIQDRRHRLKKERENEENNM